MNESVSSQEIVRTGRYTFKAPMQAGLPWLEGLWLLAMVAAFWHHSPPIRDQWTWLALLGIPLLALRIGLQRRWLNPTPFLPLLVAFLLLTAFNYQFAPLKRADYFVVVVRLFLCLALVIILVEWVTSVKSIPTILLMSFIGPSIFIVALALLATQWNTKSGVLWPIIELLPRLDRSILPSFNLSFNPNEIGGALAWAVPGLLGLALIRPRHWPDHDEAQRWRVLRALSLAGGLLGLLAMGLGQSRFALAGVGTALLLLAWLGLSGRARWLALGLLGALALAQLALLLNWFDPPGGSESPALGLTSRDENSLVTRLQIWDRGLRMLADHPLTGVGMAMFRSAVAQPRYVIPYFQQTNQVVPHAHNEFIHIGAEMGLGGLGLFVGLYAACGWCLWRTWKRGSPQLRGQALAAAAALLAHALYGLGDAISLWDRYSFLFGLLWAWCAALEVATRQTIGRQD